MAKIPKLKAIERCDVDAQATWEELFVLFETPEEERRKFIRRLKQLRVEKWNKELRIMELFCGRGSGLFAWESLGFKNVEGVDISAELVNGYSGKAKCHVGDACSLPFADESYDIVCIQGGLHHLNLTEELDQALCEINRVLSSSGRLIVIEPWQTPFLWFVHFMMGIKLVRMLSKSVETYAKLCALERETLEAWLNHPKAILEKLKLYNETVTLRIGFGKLMFIGTCKKGVK